MPDETLVVSGGSLTIRTKRQLQESQDGDDYVYTYPAGGSLTGVDLDGTSISGNVKSTSEITVHYNVP